MNFFEAQERARTQTSLLVVLFVAAIVALTALTTTLVVIFLYLQSEIEIKNYSFVLYIIIL